MLRCRTLSFLVTLGLGLAVAVPEGQAFFWRKKTVEADFFVAPDGNDAWSGTKATPTRDGTDGPFASVQRAQRAVRDRRAGQSAPVAVTVMLREGTYQITEPLLFTPEDSGMPGAPVVYAAYPGELPVISGGREIAGWTEGDDGVWQASVPEVKDGWFFSQLFADGERRQRCRMPDVGYFRIEGPLAPKPQRRTKEWSDPKCRSGFFYTEGDLQNWDDVANMNVIFYHSWTASVHWVKEIDDAEKKLVFTAGSGWPISQWEKNERYHIENVRAALNQPGEWYLDQAGGTVYYIPMRGESLRTFRPVVPVAKQLLCLKGDAAAGVFVEHLQFKGIAFKHTLWDLPRDKRHDGQAGISLTGAIYTSGSRNCRFENIEVAHVGSYGVWFATGTQENTIIHSELRDLAGGGVKIGETATPKNEATACKGNLVENCYIHDGGHMSRAGIGAWIGRSSYNTLRHNEICDFDYSAVSVGWCWGYAATSANHNIVEYNHLHHLGNGVLSDMGGIYCLGISPGTVLRGNVMHDVFSYSYGGWGLYTDEGSSDILMENNIVYNTKSGGFHQHYGRDNIVRSNILAFAQEGQIIRSRQEDHLSFTVEKNIVIFDNGRPLGGNWSNGNFLLKNNLYWDVTGEPITFCGYTLEEWQEEEGQDVGSVIKPPLFRDARNYDFRAAKHSCVKDYGIDPDVILEKAGLYGSKSWRNKPKSAKHRPMAPEMKVPKPHKRRSITRAIVEDFEGLKVGDKVEFANTSGEDKGASIRVSDEQAAGGKHSLKFVDVEGLAHNWQPHLATHMMWRKGAVTASFDVYLKPGAILWHEWRDNNSPYRMGPSLRFNGDGQLRATVRGGGKKTLTQFPLEQWVHVEITCALGKDQPGSYELAVSASGKARETFTLETVSEGWQECTWIGFVSEATTASEFYLDNLSFKRGKEK